MKTALYTLADLKTKNLKTEEAEAIIEALGNSMREREEEGEKDDKKKQY